MGAGRGVVWEPRFWGVCGPKVVAVEIRELSQRRREQCWFLLEVVR